MARVAVGFELLGLVEALRATTDQLQGGWRQIPVSTRLGIHIQDCWFSLLVAAVGATLPHVPLKLQFARIEMGIGRLADEITICEIGRVDFCQFEHWLTTNTWADGARLQAIAIASAKVATVPHHSVMTLPPPRRFIPHMVTPKYIANFAADNRNNDDLTIF